MAMTPTVVLTPEQVQFFHDEGYLTLPNIAPPEEVDLLCTVFDRLFEQRAGRAEGAQFDMVGHDDDDAPPALSQIINPVNYAEELRNTQYRVNATAIATQLLGPAITPAFEHAILKPAERGAATPWHQDE